MRQRRPRPLGKRDDAVHRRRAKGLFEAAGPIDFYPVDFRCGSQPEMKSQVAAGEIARATANFLHPLLVAGKYDNVGANTIPIGARAYAAYPNPVVLVGRLVDQQQGLRARLFAGFAALAAERIRAHPLPLLCNAAPVAPGGYVASPPGGDAQYRTALVAVSSAPCGNPHFLCLRRAELALSLSGADRSLLLAAICHCMVAYVVLRSLLLLTLEAPEPRYTLECFPIVIAFAAVALDRHREQANAATPSPSPR